MKKLPLIVLCATLALSVTGCKIVKELPPDQQATPPGPAGDAARTEQRIEKTFEPELLPYINENAVSIADLRKALAVGLEEAGLENGHQGSGEGAAWNFPVTGSGKVVEAKLDTRARTAGLDTDGDGAADITVQLGPVIKGSALRDVAPFYNFDEFRDQIEFAKLSRALNDQIDKRIVVPEGDFVGATLSFTGVVPLKKADEALVVTPISVEVR